MTTDAELRQERDWQMLHDLITETLDTFGRKDAFGKGDYWLVDENWGWRDQQLAFQSLDLLRPDIIKALQRLLGPFPDWRIVVEVGVSGTDGLWPQMGLIIYHDEVVDELQRSYFPERFRHFFYEGASRVLDRGENR